MSITYKHPRQNKYVHCSVPERKAATLIAFLITMNCEMISVKSA